ncbi:hypothetical protein EKO23_14145 [Nocardioides guangzhouensis]|uniref:Glycosyl hydrolase family 12 n=1 Tax=Nocardioides guangzhouensis TaxID=2497878 RepID=A0A4Q4ZC83_9ACTN|nr:hypothetical protein [Nocardioides guangzhouensis]RYP84906.1 hypothetical protein EKO23_14145 [Nocardioides guangzhouensis]
MNLSRRLKLVLATLLLPVFAMPLLTASPADALACSNPRVLSGSNAMWKNGGYWIHNNEWNRNIPETIRACSYRDWHVTATANNRDGSGEVKTYPNVHKDFPRDPRVTSLRTIRSHFAARGPRVGIYNIAYDIWLNDMDYEVMIWTENYRQVPSGRVVARGLKFNNRTWRVFATSGNRAITFLPNAKVTSGDMRIGARLKWLRQRGMLPATAKLNQICFGVEVVSTGGNPARFTFDNFDVRVTR